MKRFFFLALLSAIPWAANAQFTAGNLVAIRVGTGASSLTGNATNFSIDQFTTAGVLVNSRTITGLRQTGTRNYEGSLSIVRFAGSGGDIANWGVSYAGYSSPNGSNIGNTAARRVGTLRFDTPTGTESFVDLSSNAFGSGGAIFSCWSDSTKYYATGSNGGLFRSDMNGIATLISSVSVNNWVVQGSGNDAYFSSGQNSVSNGIYKVANAATGSGLTPQLILPMSGQGPCDFEINRDASGTPTSILVANLGAVNGPNSALSFASGWDSSANGGVGAFTGAATTILTSSELHTLTGDSMVGLLHIVVIGTDVYGTTENLTDSDNQIVKISYANGFASPKTGLSVVARAGTNRVFQGLEVVPEPASFLAIGFGIVALATRRRKK